MPRVGDLLTGRDVLTLDIAQSALDAARAMTAHRVGAMLVTSGGELAGIFTERDLMTRVVVAGLDPARTRLADVMTRDVFTAGPQDRVADMRREVQTRHIRHLPVVDGARIVGMLSLRDILRADLAQKTSEVESITKYIQRDELGGLA
jgi:CBS domain-containing protein